MTFRPSSSEYTAAPDTNPEQAIRQAAGSDHVRRAEVRADLNGLRGLAIGLVVVFHIWMGRVSGGVDVFLTLSGFFFTASLIRTARSGGSLNPLRRITRVLRRLAPPLILVLAAVAVASVVIYPRTRWADTAEQIVSGLFYYVNWQLAWTANDYLAADPSVSPLQHLWSVAVQFQFYLVAVLVVFGIAAIHRSMRRRQGGSPDPRLYAVVFGGLALASFVYAVGGAARHQAWNYYDTGARLWEILLGALVAVLFVMRPPRSAESAGKLSTLARGTLAATGVGVIVACGFLFDGVRVFPGPEALVPVMATIALIVAGSSTPVAGVLSNRFFAWLGSIAFPLYLWHWPILIFALAAMDRPTAGPLTGIAVIAASVALAVVTVELIEKPTSSSTWSTARITVVAGASVTAAVLLASSIGWNAYIDRSIANLQASDNVDAVGHPGALELTDGIATAREDIADALFSAPNDVPATTIEGCIQQIVGIDPLSCEYGDLGATRTIALAGGSHAEHWLSALDLLGKEHGFKVVSFVKVGCPLTVDVMPLLGEDDYPDCLDWTNNVMDTLAANPPDYVFTTSTRPRLDGPGDQTPDDYVAVWARLASYGIDVLGVRDNPWLSRDGVEYRAVDCLADGGDANSCGVARDFAFDPVDPALIASAFMPSVHPLDLSNALCDRTICRVIQGNVVIYRDEHHLTATYMRTMAPELGRQMAAATGWW